MTNKPKIVFITGCTASGKSHLAQTLAEDLNAEIISIDSMKVYKYMDIGTAKPSKEIRERIPYHLIDIVDPSEAFSAGLFVEYAERAIEQINKKNKLIIGVGGTVLYLKSLTEGIFEGPSANMELREKLKTEAETKGTEVLYRKLTQIDPITAQRLHPNDLKRIIRALEVYELTGHTISSLQHHFGRLRQDYDMLFLGVRWERETLNKRINARVKKMIKEGLVDEVRWVYERKPPMSPQARDAVGYAEIIAYFEGRWDLETAIEKIKINTRRFAKHQRTWFKRMKHIEWFDMNQATEPEKVKESFKNKIEDWLTKETNK